MPAHPSPPMPAPESSGKPGHLGADAPPPGSDAAASKPAGGATLFHLLVERGWNPELAYTADQRVRAMTSQIAAAGLQPVLAELRQMRETIEEMRERFATKDDLAGFATKADLADREARLIKWMFGALLAQAALIVGLVSLIK